MVRADVIPGELWGRFEVGVAVLAAVYLLSRREDAACADGGLAVGKDKEGEDRGED